MTIADWLDARIRSGGFVLGQVRVEPGIVVRHVDDTAAAEIFTRPEDAREVAKYDDAGNYRPLKTAPNLRRGWELRLRDVAGLRLALDFLYPAAIGTWIVCERGGLAATPLRETLGRQTGMYRVTRRITDEQAREVIREICEKGCIRHRLWNLSTSHQSPVTSPSVPLCAEACNLLIAACRPVAKQNLPKAD